MAASLSSGQPVVGNQQLQDVSLLYRFLGQSLKFPEASWFTDDFRRSFSALLNQLGAVQEALDLEKSFAESADLLEDLQVEYTRLFINGVPHVAAPPYASVYLDKSLQGVHGSRTLAFYREKGCDMSEDADLPDHIVHELEFLSHLAADNDQEGEREFLQRFFLTWFPNFRDNVLKEANHPYYRLVITMIDYFTKEEE